MSEFKIDSFDNYSKDSLVFSWDDGGQNAVLTVDDNTSMKEATVVFSADEVARLRAWLNTLTLPEVDPLDNMSVDELKARIRELEDTPKNNPPLYSSEMTIPVGMVVRGSDGRTYRRVEDDDTSHDDPVSCIYKGPAFGGPAHWETVR
jgi:hypothetical protein